MHHASPVPHAPVSHRSVVDVLLELGANPDAVDAEGMTAIMEAARAAEGFEVAERLIAAKASLNLFSKAGFTPLSLAAGSGNGPVVALLLQHGAPADAIHTDGSSALMAAAENGSEPIVKALIKVSNVNAARHDGLTALMAGCGQVGVPLVKALLDAGAEPNAQDSRGVTACHMAAEVGAVDVVTLLVQAGADCTVMAHVAAITPLIVAAAAGEEEMSALLLAITTEVDAIHTDKSAMSALMAASSNGSTAIVTHILAAGANVNMRNSDGVTALMHASVLSHDDVVEQLLAAGAELRATDNDGFDALVAAATGGSAVVSKLLIDRGLDVNVMAGSGGAPLMIAAKAGAADCVEVLLGAGAVVDTRAAPSKAFIAEIETLQAQKDDEITEAELDAKRQRLEAFFEAGSTALMHASALGHLEVVKLLVAAGADSRLKDADGQSPLVHAANSGSTRTVQHLLEHSNADPNDSVGQGVPLLVHAMASGAEALSELLLRAGAAVDAAEGGVAPILLAAQAGSTKLLQALVSRGADVNAASDSGVTPLMILASSGHVRGVKLLIESAKAPPSPPELVLSLVDATTENGTAALHTAARQAHVNVVSELLTAGASASLRDLGGQTALGAAYDGLQAVAKYVEEALTEYSATADRKLGNDMLARAAGPHIEAMELLLASGAEPSLIDKEGNTVDATQIVATYRALSSKGADEAEAAKDEL